MTIASGDSHLKKHGGAQSLTIISGSGLYALVLRRRKPERPKHHGRDRDHRNGAGHEQDRGNDTGYDHDRSTAQARRAGGFAAAAAPDEHATDPSARGTHDQGDGTGLPRWWT